MNELNLTVVTCPAEGQTFKDCGGSCERTCSDILLKRPFVCDKHYCVPGCACPAGQVINKNNSNAYMYIINSQFHPFLDFIVL